MATDRSFTHPNIGNAVRIEVWGSEVRLTFVCSSAAKADAVCDSILDQLKNGSLNITLMGKPTNVIED
jgi:hypothetical protein